MGLHVAHPKTLAALTGALIMLVGTLTVALADDPKPIFELRPSGARPEPITLTGRERAEAETALRSSPQLAGVAGSGSWTLTYIAPSVRLESANGSQATKAGASFDVLLDAPIESAGPWLFLRCRGTQQIARTAVWKNVTALRVTVDFSGRVLEIAPDPVGGRGLGGSPADRIPTAFEADRAGGTTVIWDLRSNKEVGRSGPGETPGAFVRCPPGFEDD